MDQVQQGHPVETAPVGHLTSEALQGLRVGLVLSVPLWALIVWAMVRIG